MKVRCVLIAVGMVVTLASMPAVFAQDAGLLKVVNAADAPHWKTVSLGTFASTHGLMSALDDARVAVGDLADEAMHRPAFTVTKTKSDLAVVVLSAGQLGIGDADPSWHDILARARRLGFDLCPPEVAAQLRLQYLDQPAGEYLDVAMEPITTYGGHPVVFTLGNGGAGLILIGYIVTEGAIFPQERKFVFSLPLRVARPVVP
jgi:hypothetical protein